MNDNYSKQVYELLQDEFNVICDYEKTFLNRYNEIKKEVVGFGCLNIFDQAKTMAKKLKDDYYNFIKGGVKNV